CSSTSTRSPGSAPSTNRLVPSSRRARQRAPCTMAPVTTAKRSPRRCCVGATATGATSAGESLTQQGCDQAGVGTPARCLHHVPDERLERGLTTTPKVSTRLGIRLDGLVDQRTELVGVGDLPQSALVDQCGRVAAADVQLGEQLLG